MANHVNTHVHFYKLSAAGAERLKELYNRVRQTGNYAWFSDMWVDGKEGSPTYEETEKYEWTTRVIGPKWSYVEDIYDDEIHFVSAWSAPLDGIEWLVQQIAEVDPGVRARVTYEDEMPNFAGAAVYTADGQYDWQEWDDSDLREIMISLYPELAENWDEEEGEGNEQFWDTYNEHIWEEINNIQFEYCNEVEESIDEEEVD